MCLRGNYVVNSYSGTKITLDWYNMSKHGKLYMLSLPHGKLGSKFTVNFSKTRPGKQCVIIIITTTIIIIIIIIFLS